jgi:phosphoglycerate kinase
MNLLSIKSCDLYGKKVFIRCDFNVPMDIRGGIEDDNRIRACLPTIRSLIARRARVILCSHLGRPHGRVDEHLRLGPVARRLCELLQKPVVSLRETTGPAVEQAVRGMQEGDVILLENLRFSPGEEKNDPVFSRALSVLAEIFVNDAFGASHRAHASVVGVADYLPCVSGLLMEKEIEMLSGLLEDPVRPFAAIMGGAKVGEKIGILEHILPKVNFVLVGGGMAATFLKGMGYGVGTSGVEEEKLELVRMIAGKAASYRVRLVLPVDVTVTDKPGADASAMIVPITQVPADRMIADIGPETIALYSEALSTCRTVVWNGPMGVFEIPQFSEGTRALANVLAGLDAMTVIGGGSTAEAVAQLGLTDRMSYVSTGGGASLQFLTGKVLPGIAVIPDK